MRFTLRRSTSEIIVVTELDRTATLGNRSNQVFGTVPEMLG